MEETGILILDELVRGLIDEYVNPSIAAHNAICHVITVTPDRIVLSLKGPCAGCFSLQMTEQSITMLLMEELLIEDIEVIFDNESEICETERETETETEVEASEETNSSISISS